MPPKPEYLNYAMAEAAIALLHREIARHGEVRLTQQDFAEVDAATEAGQAIQLDVGPGEVIIFTHAKRDNRPTS